MEISREGTTQDEQEESEAGVSPGGDGSNQAWVLEGAGDSTFKEGLESMHNQFMFIRKMEMETRKLFDEELQLAVEQGWTASAHHVMEMKGWVQELEERIVIADALGQLDSSVGYPESHILQARLRKLGVAPDDLPVLKSVDNNWVPLSGFPVEHPDEGSHCKVEEACVKPPGSKGLNAVPAAPLQTVSVSHREVLERVEEWRPTIGAELESVFERHQALQRTSKDQMDQWISQGKVVEFLPSKALFHKKQDQNSGMWELR